MKQPFIASAVAVMILTFGDPAAAQRYMGWEITGGAAWAKRVGPGVMGYVGGVDCTDRFCDNGWNSQLVGSAAAAFGMYYRLIPNAAIFAEAHAGYLNVDRFKATDEHGLSVQFTVGGSFHTPIFDWLDLSVGLGLGYALLWATALEISDEELNHILHGITFEFRTGADIFPFDNAPTLAIGPIFKLGMPVWVAYDTEESSFKVWERGDLPLLVFWGIGFKYGF